MKRYIFLIILAFASTWIIAPAARAGEKVQFNHDIRPILTENCFQCHGPDPGSRKEGLRLDREDGLFGDRKNGKAVVKGDPAKSLLYQRISTEDEDDVMPPPKSKKSLKPAEKELIRKWIEQGANWEAHWAFIPPSKAPLPEVQNKQWVRNAIDAFILAKLEAKGLTPAPEAEKRAIIRRLALDLTGLPPAPADVEAFVADQSPEAYEKIVDKFLASPHYGEHRARYWLDAVRYADTHGLHFDNYREMFPYRDWVINAFNANVRFDQFTIEQIAGDLLPNRTMAQQIASGYNRCNLSTNEGGTILEENLVLYTRDRTETTARIWLGLTANCAVCHDHKFDPISQKEFYSLSAFFNNSQVGALDGNIKDTPPIISVPSAEDAPKWAALSADLSKLGKERDARRAAVRPAFDKWLAGATPESVRKTIPLTGLQVHAPLSDGAGTVTHIAVDGQIRQVDFASKVEWKPGQISAQAAKNVDGAIAAISDVGDFERDQKFTVALWAKLPGKTTGALVARMDEKKDYRGWDLFVEGDKLVSHFASKWRENAFKVVSKKGFDVNKWHHFALVYDGTSKASGVRLYVDGVQQELTIDTDALKDSIKTTAPLTIGARTPAQVIKGLTAQDLRIHNKALSGDEIRTLAKATRLVTVLSKPADKRSEPEKNELFDWYVATNDVPSREIGAKIAAAEAARDEIKGRSPVTHVMEERPEPAKAYVLFRGDYDKRRDEVKPSIPAVLPQLPADASLNRLSFANWLLRPDNPLTARVTINRMWQELFGTGIVKTTEDFGIMGEMPSHQELLDYLAVDFRESSWDVKRMYKQIVMSAAYRQSAATTPAKLEKDRENRLVSRGPRFRNDAETIRDVALASSGLLVPKVGGPSVKPYQPPGVWEAVAMPESNTKAYKADTGEGLYRRSVYTFWKRAAPPAQMDVFNAPSRETCTVRRERTNTPLQALVTLNDPQYVEAARTLAQYAIKNGGDTFETRLDFVTMRLISRPMSAEEVKVVRSAFDDLSAHYKANAEDAKKLLAVGESKRDDTLDAAEHATWTMLVNQLLNLDEVLNK